jgi:hypothetical protein
VADQYAARHLQRSGLDQTGWIAHFRCPHTGKPFVLDFPQSEYHGGGPARLQPREKPRRKRKPRQMRSTNVLDVDTLVWLDEVGARIKLKAEGKSIRRSEIMRAVLGALRIQDSISPSSDRKRSCGKGLRRNSAGDEIRESNKS